MPTLRALELVVAIAEHGSLTRAGTALALSQPAVSHQIDALEAELGVALVHRTRSGTTLTIAGRAFVPEAREALRHAQTAIRRARQATAAEPLRVVAAESFTIPFVARAVRRWHQQGNLLPALTETMSADDAVDALRRGDHDLAVLPGTVAAAGLSEHRLGVERIVVVGLGDRRPAVTLDELRDEPWVGIRDENGFGRWLTARFPELAVSEQGTLRTRSLQSAAVLADAGFGVTIVPETAVPPDIASIQLDPPVTRPIVALWPGAASQPVRDLVARLDEALAGAVRGDAPGATAR